MEWVRHIANYKRYANTGVGFITEGKGWEGKVGEGKGREGKG